MLYFLKSMLDSLKFNLGPDRNSGSGPVPIPVEFGLVPVPVDFGRYQTGTAIFLIYYRFYDELPALRAPSSSQTASRALLQLPGCITCSPPVPRLYHVLPSSSQNVSCPPPPLWLHLERKIIFIFTVCCFYWFHIKHRHFRIIILLAKLICHKFFTLTWKTKILWY